MQKAAFIACLCAVAAFAMPALTIGHDADTAMSAVVPEMSEMGGGNDIELILIHTIPCTFAQEVLDLASWTSGSSPGEDDDWLFLIDSVSMKMYSFDIPPGGSFGRLNLYIVPITNPYGVAITGYYWEGFANVYLTDGPLLYTWTDSWESWGFPWCPGIGRCIDWDPLERRLWTVNHQFGINHLISFLWEGDWQPYKVLDAADDQYLGIGVFPFEGDLGFVFSEENELELDFYRRRGKVLEKIGEAEVDFMPGINRITSVDWHYTREIFYCAYEVGGDYYVSEFDVDFGASDDDVGPPTTVTETTFGQIKAMFR